MKTYGGVDVQIRVILTSALVGGEWSASGHGHFTPGTHWIGAWVGPRTGLGDAKRRESCLYRDSNWDSWAVQSVTSGYTVEILQCTPSHMAVSVKHYKSE
jgi:hypothetical protein